MAVTSINNGDYIKVKGVNFGTGAVSFDARVASASSGGNIELRLDSQTGTLVGTCAVQGTGGLQTWATKSCAVSGATGIHDLYLKFTGGSGALFNFNWWKFTPRDPLPDAGEADAADAGAMDAGVPDASGGGASGGGGSGGGTAGGASGSGGQPSGTGGMAAGSGGAVGMSGSSPGTGGSAGSASGGGPKASATKDEAGCACQSGPRPGNSELAFLAFVFATLLRRRAASGPSLPSRR